MSNSLRTEFSSIPLEHHKSAISARFQLAFNNGNQPQSASFILDVDLELPGKGVTAIFGHSGSGKTTVLRCLAGLQQVPNGYINVNGQVWQDSNQVLPTHKRPLGYVFQESSLFPHLNTGENLEYAIKRSRSSISQKKTIVELMGIGNLLKQYPQQLSGGERQRVAIARALLIKPAILLMDEPLAALDQRHKQEILPYLESLCEEIDLPILYVSHSIDEVSRLANHLVVLDKGRVHTSGPLLNVLSRLDPFLQHRDNAGVVWDSIIKENDGNHLQRLSVNENSVWVKHTGKKIGKSIRLRISAKDISITLTDHNDSSILNRMNALVADIETDADPAHLLVRLEVNSDILIARITKRSAEHLKLTVGMNVWAQIKSVAIVR